MREKKIKVMIIFGTRPEAIKLMPVIKKLQSDKNNFISKICVTAQHRDMLDQVMRNFNLRPDYDLNIMHESQNLSEIFSNSLVNLSKIINLEHPDILLIQGDTSSTLAGALAAFCNKILIGHIEAGLRTFNKYSPFPEEINRKLLSSLADLHFAPTQDAKENLLKENINQENIFVTGNTCIDCVKLNLKKDYEFNNKILNKLDYKANKFILLTAHRRENLGEPLENIFKAVVRLSHDLNLKFIYPVHKNPVVREAAKKFLSNKQNIYILEPLDVFDMHNLISRCELILTDSGGLQEEAPSLNKPVIVLRSCTERSEGLKAGVLKLAGTCEQDIYNSVKEIIFDRDKYLKMSQVKNPFGDGNAAERIINAILFYFNQTERPKDFMSVQ